LKVISKRARQETVFTSPVPGLEVTEVTSTSVIITSSSTDMMSPEDIKRAIEVFQEMRRQLEGGITIQ
jgi:hypothetical protein